MVIAKTDLLKQDPNYYKVGTKPEIRDLDVYYYLTISGKSAPEDDLFLQAITAIYKVAFPLKFMMKDKSLDFVVPKMEAFWWIDGGAEVQKDFMTAPREEWNWKILIRLPDFVEEVHYDDIMNSLLNKKKKFPLIDQIKYEKINEGRCVQTLHNGSYENEKDTLDKVHQFIKAEGYQINNYHHEIYLSDPRRTPEEKLRTIIRYGIA